MRLNRLANGAALLAVWVGTFAAAPQVDAQTYRAIKLGQLTRDLEYFNATGLNNANQVVGYTVPGSLFTRAVLWQTGTVTDLGSLSGGDGAQAFAINNAGVVVGISETAVAVSWTGGTIASLGTLAGTGPTYTSNASAINSSGQIVGWSTPAAGGNPTVHLTAFLYSGGTMSSLNPSGAFDSFATGIDDSGNVVGYLATPPYGAPKQAMLWSGGTATVLPFVPPVDSTTYAVANAVNNQFQIVGSEGTPDRSNNSLAVVWSFGSGAPTATALQGDGSASGINNAGQIVGGILAGSGSFHAALWQSVVAPGLDLNNLIDPATPIAPLVLIEATGINDNGAITAIASADGGMSTESVLLVPEPLSLSVTPATLTFAAQSVGTTSVAQVVSVKNTGTAAFNIGSIQVTGDYSQTNTCGAALAAGARCSISVRFAPTAPGTRPGVLTLASGGTSFTANLTGYASLSFTFTASASAAAAGAPFTLGWKAPGTSCVASGGTAGDGWAGNLAASGSIAVTEKTVGVHTYGISCSGGGQTASAKVSVTVGLPTVQLTAAPTTVAFGRATTLTWTSTFASSCTASGGATGDAWAGAKGPSGSKAITESASGSYSYTLSCGAGSISASTMAVVTVNPIPASGMGGGGGAIDPFSLWLLLAVVGLSAWRRAHRHGRSTAFL